jgi:thymidylate synthase (FAD)
MFHIVKPSATLVYPTTYFDVLEKLERIGRVSYKSEDRITEDSAESFVRMILRAGHESVIEHHSETVLFIVDRGVSHEIVRHRIASFTQESTRYCDYHKKGSIAVIEPPLTTHDARAEWYGAMEAACDVYTMLRNQGVRPQLARDVLPHSLKTELYMTANLREWRHFLRLRTAKAAHPQMREVTIPLLAQFRTAFPVLFEDIACDETSAH